MAETQSWARDEIDTKIIGLLFENARRNFAEIGKELGISKNAVWSRYRKMKYEGVITGATVQINFKRLGYDAVGTLLLDVEPSQLEQDSKYIEANVPEVFGPFLSASRYSLRAVVALKTISELGKIKDDLRRKLCIEEISSSIWTDVWFIPENLTLLPIQPVDANKKSVDNRVFDADEIDLHLISALAKDSRLSFRTMAEQLGVSIDTVARRCQKLNEESVIMSRIQVNPFKIGYSALANFYLRILPQYEVDTIIREIFPTPDVFYLMKCNGDFNICAMLMVKNVQDMLETGDRITRIPGVKRLETVPGPLTEKWPLPRTYTSTFARDTAAT
ncbi:MAG: AsnC family transcriptional regulator [Candidatus Bathyarchaeia archaeon]|jgi:Lrp/AsnC family transcriptional regulator for asnA, asnC and gidA